MLSTPVLIVMFTRHKTLNEVFEQIKKARPRKLYLYQDGPRQDNYEADMRNIEKCREIVSDIDWECDVRRWYQDINYGADPSSYFAHKWLFDNEEKGIVLEDDVVPSQSFFTYCEELLKKYENDQRIFRICGVNAELRSPVKESYLFSRKGSTGSWASWRRVAKLWDPSYTFLDDQASLEALRGKFENEDSFRQWLKTAKGHRDSGRVFYETVYYECKLSRGMLDIIPQKNLVTNIGLTPDAVNTNYSYKTIRRTLRSYFFAKRFELDMPLRHPVEVKENMHYTRFINRKMGWGHPWLRKWYALESAFFRYIYGDKRQRAEMRKKLRNQLSGRR